MIQVAVDGPAVSGKSSTAKHLARRLGFLYLDSGAVYRAITLAVLRGLVLEDPLPPKLDALGLELGPHPSGLGCAVRMEGEDVSERIRAEDVTCAILPISGHPDVRAWVTGFLRAAAGQHDVVMDGRDIATVVFADARFKFFVTASLEARSERRRRDLERQGQAADSARIAEMLRRRDEGDMSRPVGPLRRAPDAVLIDNSATTLEETVERMADLILRRHAIGRR